MAKQVNKLSDPEIRRWIKAGVPVAKADGDGLTFTLSAAGTAAWVLDPRLRTTAEAEPSSVDRDAVAPTSNPTAGAPTPTWHGPQSG